MGEVPVRQILVISKPLTGGVSEVLSTVGFDRGVKVVVVGSDEWCGECGSIQYVSSRYGAAVVSRAILKLLSDLKPSEARFVLSYSDPLSSATVFTLYMLLNTVERLVDVYVEPLYLVHDGELHRFPVKPRLCLDLRDVAVLSRLDRCVYSRELAGVVGIPPSSLRRRLLKLLRENLVEARYTGRRVAFCPTQLSRAFIDFHTGQNLL